MWRLLCDYLFLISPSFGASGWLCFLMVALPGYIHFPVCFPVQQFSSEKKATLKGKNCSGKFFFFFFREDPFLEGMSIVRQSYLR